MRKNPHPKRKKKKNFVLLLNIDQPTCHMDEPCEAIKSTWHGLKGELAPIVDTARESSRLKHGNV